MTSGSENMDGFDFQMTQDQRAQGEWEIANMGRITMYQFKVSETRIITSRPRYWLTCLDSRW
jgi:hypothetical protein